MTKRSLKMFYLLVVWVLMLAGCQPIVSPQQAVTPAGSPNLPNPASVYCQEQGHGLEIRTDASGGQYGVCVFPDGSECDEWAYFRGECSPGSGSPAVEMGEIPAEVWSAFEAALAHVADHYPQGAPAPGLDWKGQWLDPQGLVGSSAVMFNADTWLVTIRYPIVAPDQVIYQVDLENQGTGFEWHGQVDAKGQVNDAVIYRNEAYGYQLQIPPTATLVEHGVMTIPTDELPEGMSTEAYFQQLRDQYPEGICVEITERLGTITISAAANRDLRYTPCGRTGVGQGAIVEKTETVFIGNQELLATGFEYLAEPAGESLNRHNETMTVWLPDGIRIQYGALPEITATFDDYQQESKPVLLRILASFRQLGQ